MIDLHCHSTASDGSFSPTELVELATKRGIRALGIADHDTLDGLPDAVKAGVDRKLCVIPAIELSVNSPWGSLHMLGYFSRSDPPNLSGHIAEIQSFRNRRNPIIAEKLQSLGIPINLDDVKQIAGGQVVGRPHFAQVMLRMRTVSSTQEAFDRYLKKGAPAYVDRERLHISDAIDLIRADDGIPVLAHPGLIPLPHPNIDLKYVVESFVGMGGGGIEAYAPVHSRSLTSFLLDLADRFHLIVTGGTDFHGETKPELHLGSGNGDFLVPDDLLPILLNSLKEIPCTCLHYSKTPKNISLS